MRMGSRWERLSIVSSNIAALELEISTILKSVAMTVLPVYLFTYSCDSLFY
jgi:hypothetical protein